MSKDNSEETTASKGTEVDKQSTKVLPIPAIEPIFPEGATIRATSKGKKRICVVDKIILTGSGVLRYRIRPLNRTITCTVAEKDLEHIDPEPADIPLKLSDVDS